MAQQTDLQALSLCGLAHRCSRETELFFARLQHDPHPCFELFRRALVDGSQRAWGVVYAQYQAQVTRWVQRHTSFSTCGEEAAYLVNRAFEKMWSAIPPDRFCRFPDLKSLLRYLQMCAHSAVIDAARKTRSGAVNVDAMVLPVGGAPAGRAVDDHAIAQVHRAEFWEAVTARLNDEAERCVVYGSYVLGLKPRQLLMKYPETFHDVRDVYRAKENVLARLRRDETLHTFLRGGA